MSMLFSRIGLMGRYASPAALATLTQLTDFLTQTGRQVFAEAETAAAQGLSLPQINMNDFAGKIDLLIVIGGDGSLLHAAHAVVDANIPLIGLNRGHLGFLTDLSADHFESDLSRILQGEYTTESRFLLDVAMVNGEKIVPIGSALNDVVLYAGEVARMINFELWINNEFVYSQRSDGLIIATPTGSTAYALSAGGPILHPALESIVLVPMFPHTLTSRPLVVHSNAEITLRMAPMPSQMHPAISCDGQALIVLNPDASLRITRKTKQLRLLHPPGYDYYHTLREKLGWGHALRT